MDLLIAFVLGVVAHWAWGKWGHKAKASVGTGGNGRHDGSNGDLK